MPQNGAELDDDALPQDRISAKKAHASEQERRRRECHESFERLLTLIARPLGDNLGAERYALRAVAVK